MIQLKVHINLFGTYGFTQNGDGAGVLRETINNYYREWNPSNDGNSKAVYNNSAVGTGVTLDVGEWRTGSNARNAGGYSSSHIRATLIGANEKTNIGYAGDVNLSKENCLYSCIDKNLGNVIVAKRIKYVTGTSTTDYILNNDIVDKIWLFSEREMYGTGQYSGNETEGIGSTGVGYDKFGNINSKYYMSSYNIDWSMNRMPVSDDRMRGEVWLRSTGLSTKSLMRVCDEGRFGYSLGNRAEGLAFGFCLR